MSNHIFEEKPPADAPQQIGGAKAQIEKQARQLLYDSRYQVKKAIKGQKIDPVNLQKMIIQRIDASKSIPAVRTRAKQMMNVKEEYTQYMEDSASDLVANALYKVFVEGVKKEEVIDLDYLNELAENPDKKYKVTVYDPKNDTRYVRYATREKITQLRSKGLRVELTEYGEPRESEAKKGSQTASALGGGKANKDYDRDGKVESGAKEHAGAVHNAIQRKKGGVPDGKDTSSVKEDFITDATTVDQNTKKITGKGVDNSSLVKVFPQDGTEDRAGKSVNPTNVFSHYDMHGNPLTESQAKFVKMIQEKAESEQQQKLFGLALSVKMGQTPRSEVSAEVLKIVDTMSEKKIRDFAKTKHEGIPKKVNEDAECDTKKVKEVDPRQLKTMKDRTRTSLGLMGIKSSYEPEGEMTEAWSSGRGRRGPDRNALGGADRDDSPRYRNLGSPTPRQEAEENQRAKEASKRAVEQLRRRRAAEEARKNRG